MNEKELLALEIILAFARGACDKEIKERQHCELEAEHYKLVRTCPEYRHEGQMNCLYESMMLSMPYRSTKETYTPQVEQPEPEWARKQWDYVQQLQARVLHCENKVVELLSSFKKRKQRLPKYTIK